jgi:hypothetical protein
MVLVLILKLISEMVLVLIKLIPEMVLHCVDQIDAEMVLC